MLNHYHLEIKDADGAIRGAVDRWSKETGIDESRVARILLLHGIQEATEITFHSANGAPGAEE